MAITVTLAATLAPAACVHAPRANPEQSQIHTDLAADSYRQNRMEAALGEISKALEQDPRNADAYNLLGLIALRQGAEQMDGLEVASCLKGSDAEAVRREATDKFREAKRELGRAVELRPAFSQAWNNLSVAALQLQEYDLAIEAARSALKDIAYNEPQVARANLGWALFKKRAIQDAWKELYESATANPGFCVGHYRLASLYKERGDLDLAAQEIDQVVGRKDCPIQEAYLLGGLVQDRLKHPDRARELFSRCTALAPRSCLAAECTRYREMIP